MTSQAGAQRSFRLSARTLELLDTAAAASPETRNALADRLLGEALRLERHPLIRFHSTRDGRRQPILVGTRLYVYQVIATLRGHDGDVHETSEYLGLIPQQVQAALEYYAEFRDEVDADSAHAELVEQRERDRWERQQQALA